MITMTIVGRLGKDPTFRALTNGEACSGSIASNEKWTDKSGEAREHTEWVNFSAFRWAVEAFVDAVKGDPVIATGTLRTRKYQAQDGTERSVTELIVSHAVCGKRRSGDARQSRPPEEQGGRPRSSRPPAPPQEDLNDIIPF